LRSFFVSSSACCGLSIPNVQAWVLAFPVSPYRAHGLRHGAVDAGKTPVSAFRLPHELFDRCDDSGHRRPRNAVNRTWPAPSTCRPETIASPNRRQPQRRWPAEGSIVKTDQKALPPRSGGWLCCTGATPSLIQCVRRISEGRFVVSIDPGAGHPLISFNILRKHSRAKYKLSLANPKCQSLYADRRSCETNSCPAQAGVISCRR
jgi:hypothetical protein